MKKIIALVLCAAMLFACAAATAENAKVSMGTLKVNKAFDIHYDPLPDYYSLNVIIQNDMTIFADITTPDTNLPKLSLAIAFNDEWADTEKLNDVSEADMQEIKDSFCEEYSNPTFEIRETDAGTQLLTVMSPTLMDAYVYTIYMGHEIEFHIVPGDDQYALTGEDINRVVTFLNGMEFVPVETAQ